VIHEAMAAGLPVLTFAGNGGASEAVSGGCGLTMPYGNYSEMGNALRLLKTQPTFAGSLSDKSREKVKTTYRFGAYADSIIEMAESVSQTTMRLRPRIYQESRAA
jgi:glycosyltransferase involved in cell wall biosynthesis